MEILNESLESFFKKVTGKNNKEIVNFLPKNVLESFEILTKDFIKKQSQEILIQKIVLNLEKSI